MLDAVVETSRVGGERTFLPLFSCFHLASSTMQSAWDERKLYDRPHL